MIEGLWLHSVGQMPDECDCAILFLLACHIVIDAKMQTITASRCQLYFKAKVIDIYETGYIKQEITWHALSRRLNIAGLHFACQSRNWLCSSCLTLCNWLPVNPSSCWESLPVSQINSFSHFLNAYSYAFLAFNTWIAPAFLVILRE